MTPEIPEPTLVLDDHGLKVYALGPIQGETHAFGTNTAWRVWRLDGEPPWVQYDLSRGYLISWRSATDQCFAAMRDAFGR